MQDDGVLYTLSDCRVWLPSSFKLPGDAVDFMRISPRACLEHCDSYYVSLILAMNHEQTTTLLRCLVNGVLASEELWWLIKPSRRTCRKIVRESRVEGSSSSPMATSSLLIACSVERDFQMSFDARLNLVTFVRDMADHAHRELNDYLMERDAPIVEEIYMFVDGGSEERQWLLM